MLPGMELMGCADLAVPAEVMRHVIQIESSSNPYAIGVVGGRLARQPRSLAEALATVRMLEEKGYNFSVGLAQVNRHNLDRYGLSEYTRAFQTCPNIQAGARILAECHQRARGDWGKAFSCYYSGNFVTGFKHGYVQKVMASLAGAGGGAAAITVEGAERPEARSWTQQAAMTVSNLLARRMQSEAAARPAAEVALAALPAAQGIAPGEATVTGRNEAPGSPAPEGARSPVMVQLVGAATSARPAPEAPLAPPSFEVSAPVTPGRAGGDEAFVF